LALRQGGCRSVDEGKINSPTELNPGKRHFPRARGQIYLAGAGESAPIGDLNDGVCRPPMFALALVSSLTDAAEHVAVVEVCRPDLAESPVPAAAREGGGVEDRSEAGARPLKNKLDENATGWSGRVGLSDHLQRKFPDLSGAEADQWAGKEISHSNKMFCKSVPPLRSSARPRLRASSFGLFGETGSFNHPMKAAQVFCELV
jgi:hypothetical protein